MAADGGLGWSEHCVVATKKTTKALSARDEAAQRKAYRAFLAFIRRNLSLTYIRPLNPERIAKALRTFLFVPDTVRVHPPNDDDDHETQDDAKSAARRPWTWPKGITQPRTNKHDRLFSAQVVSGWHYCLLDAGMSQFVAKTLASRKAPVGFEVDMAAFVRKHAEAQPDARPDSEAMDKFVATLTRHAVWSGIYKGSIPKQTLHDWEDRNAPPRKGKRRLEKGVDFLNLPNPELLPTVPES